MVRAWAPVFVGLVALQVLSSDGAIVRGPADRKQLALVFTGHEFAEGGSVILDALARHRAKASFFLTGDFLRNPSFQPFTRRLVREGHYLGPHSDRHLLYCDWKDKRTLVTRDAFLADLRANAREIAKLRPERPDHLYFLPAYEWCNAEIVGWARDAGFATVNLTPGTRSNADYTEDAEPNHVSSQAIIDSIRAAEAKDAHGLAGFLLLMHVGAGPRRTDKLHARLDELLDVIASKGYRFVAIDELLEGR